VVVTSLALSLSVVTSTSLSLSPPLSRL
jgi:hypothetical protein